MSYAKKNDFILVKKIKFKRTSKHRRSIFETNKMKCKKKSSCKKSSKRRVSFDLNNQFVEYHDEANRDR